MGDLRGDPHPDSLPEDAPASHPDTPPAGRDEAARIDIDQSIETVDGADAADTPETFSDVGAAEDPAAPDAG